MMSKHKFGEKSKHEGRSNNRAFATLSTLLIAALAIALASSFGQVATELVKKTLPREDIATYVKNMENGKVEVINPSHFAADLSKLGVLINHKAARVSDENGNGLWEPGEKITIDFSHVQENTIVLEVYYDNKLMQKFIYIRPIPLYDDKAFPTVTYKNDALLWSQYRFTLPQVCGAGGNIPEALDLKGQRRSETGGGSNFSAHDLRGSTISFFTVQR